MKKKLISCKDQNGVKIKKWGPVQNIYGEKHQTNNYTTCMNEPKYIRLWRLLIATVSDIYSSLLSEHFLRNSFPCWWIHLFATTENKMNENLKWNEIHSSTAILHTNHKHSKIPAKENNNNKLTPLWTGYYRTWSVFRIWISISVEMQVVPKHDIPLFK